MGLTAAQWSLITSILSVCIAVSSAIVSWRWGSRVTQLRKWARGRVLTETSDVKLAAVHSDLAELSSTLQKLTTTVRRLSSRHGMQDMRERRSQQDQPPPPGNKAAARAFYLHGKTPAQIASLHKPSQTDIEDEQEQA